MKEVDVEVTIHRAGLRVRLYLTHKPTGMKVSVPCLGSELRCREMAMEMLREIVEGDIETG